MATIRNPRRAVASLFVLTGVLFGLWASRVPAVTEKHDLSPHTLGILLLLLAFGATVAFAISGRASDRLGPPRVARAFGVAAAAALILVALAPNVWLLGAALFLFGACLGGLDVAMNGWAAEVERARGRPIMSSMHAMYSVGAGLGAATGYVAASIELGLIGHFAIVALASAAACLWMANVAWETGRPIAVAGGPLYTLPKGPLILVAIVAFSSSIGEGGMADWSAVFLVAVTEVSDAKAALGFTVFSVAMLAMRLVGDRAVARFGPAVAGRASGVVAALGVVIAVAAGTYSAALVGFALMGVGYALIMPLAFSRAANDGVMSQGAAIAAVATLGYGGVMIGPPVIGFIAEATSLRFAFLLLAAFAVLIIVYSGALQKPRS